MGNISTMARRRFAPRLIPRRPSIFDLGRCCYGIVVDRAGPGSDVSRAGAERLGDRLVRETTERLEARIGGTLMLRR